jgi:exosortase
MKIQNQRMGFQTRTILVLAVVSGSGLLNMTFFRKLAAFSLENDFASLAFFIPVLSIFLLVRERARIFQEVRSSILAGGTLCALAAGLLAYFALARIGLSEADVLSAKTMAFVLLWIGAFVFFYGLPCARRAIFPLLFLLLTIPIPKTLLASVVSLLQKGSAEMTAALFKITGTPYYRDHLSFVLPRISIEIAEECSGIRSSLALMISCLIAGHLVLRTAWRKVVFTALVLPMAMLKNAIRIFILSLLSIHIDNRWIVSSDLHRKGGIVFFVLTLSMILPVLWVLRRSERKSNLHENDGLKAV